MTSHISTAVVVAAASYDLTDLATVKDELALPANDTASDTWLKRANTQTSKAIANYCNRVFQVETVADTVNFESQSMRSQIKTGNHGLKLERWPLIAVQSVVENGTTLVAGTDYTLDLNSGLIFRLTKNSLLTRPWPPLQTIVTYTAGYGAQVTQTTSIPATPGPYVAAVLNAATFAQDGGVSFVGGAALVPVASAPAVGQYSVTKGVYTFNAADQAKNVAVTYLFNQIPDDLVEATLRLITQRFKQRGRDPMLVSEESPGVGNQRWWVGATPGQNGAFPPEICGLLDPYCVPGLA